MSSFSQYLDPQLVQRLNKLPLTARSVAEGNAGGRHRGKLRGSGIEFHQHRFYVPGDEPRRLDWRVLGRTDRPYIKEYDQETNLRGVLLLDASGSMAYGRRHGRKMEYAARLTAALAYLMLGQNESVGLAIMNQKLGDYLSPKGGGGQLARLIDLLQRTPARGTADPRQALGELAERLERRSLVILISDLLSDADQWRSGLAHLRYYRHEVILLRVLDDDEIDFPFQKWSRFQGLEAEGTSLCDPTAMRRQYQAAFAAHRKRITECCTQLDIEWQDFRTGRPLADSLCEFLARRAKQV